MQNIKIIQIGVSYDYAEFYCEQMRRSNPNFFYCKDIYRTLSGIKKILFKINNSQKLNSIFLLPFRKIWSRYAITEEIERRLNKNDLICFIYQGGMNYFDIGVFDYIRRKYSNSFLIYKYNDLVSLNERLYPGFLKRCKNIFDLVMTYNAEDAEKYDLILDRPKIFEYSKIGRDLTHKPADVFFIGQNKGRLKKLISIFEQCKEHGLVCDFSIIGVEENEQVYRDEIKYNIRIPYVEMLSRQMNSKCVLNFIQDGAKGITLRDYESIGMNKILLTNNYYIKSTDFYDEDHVMFVDNIDFERIKSYNDNHWKKTVDYSIDKYNKWFIKTIMDNKDRRI